MLLAFAASAAPDPSVPARQDGAGACDGALHRAAASRLGQLQFVPNEGQWPEGVRYAALGETAGWLHDDGFTLRFERWAARSQASAPVVDTRREQSGCVVRTHFVGAGIPEFVPGERLETVRHFFVGDAATWRRDVPSFANVTMRGVLPGIDVRFRPLPDTQRGPFEFDLLLQPGADLSAFAARCDGADRLRIDDRGRLCVVVRTPDGPIELLHEAPVAWQETPAGRRELRVAFRLLDRTTWGFAATDLDPMQAAVVDPGVVWATWLGGGASDSINAMRWAPGTGVWVAGWAGSTNFPATPGAYRTVGGADGFVARLNDDGTVLQFATYLGGASGDEVRGLALGPGDTPTVVGFTHSADFPVTPGAADPSYSGGSPFLDIGDGFVARLSANGSALLAATYLGGIYDDVAEAVAVDATGAATVVGWTSSPDFPSTPGVFQPVLHGVPGVQSDGFVTKVAASAQSIVFSTFLGGGFGEQLLTIDRDPVSGDAIVGGWSLGPDYPTTQGVVRENSNGLLDAVVTRLNPTGTTAVFSTYLGGLDGDVVTSVRVAPDGTVWAGGFTLSANYPATPNAPQTTLGGQSDGFVTQLSANAQSMPFSTLLGGAGQDKVRAIDVTAGGIIAVGEAGDGFPITQDAEHPSFSGGNLDAFVSFFTNGGSVLTYSSYFGGADQDVLGSVELTDSGLAVVGGWSFSGDYPMVPAALQSQLLGVEDGVLMKIDLVSTFGDGLTVAPDTGPTLQVVGDGEHRLLGAVLTNVTTRDVMIDAIRVLIAGAGNTPARVADVRWFASGGALGTVPVQVGGPMNPAADDRDVAVPLTGLLLPAGSTAQLFAVGNVTADPTGASAEIALAIVDTNAWTLHAIGAGGGPEIRVGGTGRVAGPVLVTGAMPGDQDRDGLRTVVDVRRQLAALGANDPAADCDGDGVVTSNDVTLTRQALLGRPTSFGAPAAVARGEWLTLRGLFPEPGSLQASLGGSAMTRGCLAPREITLRVSPQQPLGTQELIVTDAGRVVLDVLVVVQ